jgi:hypothetical protein
MLKLIIIRGLVAVMVVATGAVAYVAFAGADVSVSAPGCGTIHPPSVLTLAWNATSDGGVAKVPPWTVHVDATSQNGHEKVTVKGPVGISASFDVGSNVMLVKVDGTLLFQRPGLLRTSMAVDLGSTKHHYVVAVCR